MYKNTLHIVRLATLVALSVAAASFKIIIGVSNSISFIYIPIFIAGIYLGPVAGGIVGLLGDVLGALIIPKGPYLLFIGISSMLTGIIPGLIFKIKKIHPVIKIVISFLLCYLICTAAINTVGLWYTFSRGKKSFIAYFLLRVPPQFLNIAVNFTIMLGLYEIKIFDKIFADVIKRKKQIDKSEVNPK